MTWPNWVVSLGHHDKKISVGKYWYISTHNNLHCSSFCLWAQVCCKPNKTTSTLALNIPHQRTEKLTLEEKLSKSLSVFDSATLAVSAIRKLVEAAERRATGEKAAEYLSADAAKVVSIRELKDVMVNCVLYCWERNANYEFVKSKQAEEAKLNDGGFGSEGEERHKGSLYYSYVDSTCTKLTSQLHISVCFIRHNRLSPKRSCT